MKRQELGAGQIWLGLSLGEGGGSPALEEGKSQSLLIQVLSLSPLPSSSFSLFLLSLPIAHGPFRLPDPLFFVLGAAPIMSVQLPGVRDGVPVTRGRVPGGQRPSKDSLWWLGQRQRGFMTSCRWPGPVWSLLHLVAHPCLKGIGVHQPQWSWTQQPKSLRLQP